MEKKFSVSGMHCASCALNIENSLKKVKGIKKVNINFATEKADIEFDKRTNEKEIIKKIKNLGYEATLDISVDYLEIEKSNLRNKLILSSILSIPLMFIMNKYILFILATPVQFYVGYQFYKGAFNALKNKTANMDTLIVLGTSAAYFYSIFSEHQYFETSAILITLVILGKYLEASAKGRTSEAIKKLMKLKPKTAVVIRNKKEIEIPIDEILVNDIVLVKPGGIIPVDGIIVEGFSSIDESMITGESMPVEKKKNDFVIGGTINKYGSFKFKATKVGKNTTLAKIIKLIEDAQASKAPIQRFADLVSSYFVPVVLLVALVTFTVWNFSSNLEFSLMAAVSVLVIACPCALGLATPTAIIVGTGLGAQKGILIKNSETLENAYKVKYLVFDKTGTITKGNLEITDVVALKYNKNKILKIAASIEKNSEHPIAKLIADKVKNVKRAKNFTAIPGKGVRAKIGSKEYLLGNEKLINADFKKINEFKEQGKTVILLAENKKPVGIIAVSDTIKETSKKAVEELKNLGLEVYMITGDNKVTAKAIAEKAGIKNVLSEVMPDEKVKYIVELQKKGKVAMVGDGINDAPALAKADIGIAMGSGTDVAIESGNIVLMKNDLLDIPKAIKLSRETIKKIKQNMFWALFYNSLGIPLASLGLLNPVIAGTAMALSSVSVVTNSLLLKRAKI